MKKKFLARTAAVGVAAVLSAGALAMFAGCTSARPEVTVTYNFNGKDYAVEYVLSRSDAPQTVQHFIELADAGFYDGLVVHDYQDYRMYAGGYRITNGELEEVDYFSTVRALEEEKNIRFTQSVWKDEACKDGTYTVYGEFSANGIVHEAGKELSATTGALVMYYTDKGNYNGDVTVRRADGGSGNDGDATQLVKYKYNSATSLFYTFTGENMGNVEGIKGETIDETANYCVFGMAKHYTDQLENGLLKAVNDYKATLDGDAGFTEEKTMKLNGYEEIGELGKGDLYQKFETPLDKPITIKSVKVTKY